MKGGEGIGVKDDYEYWKMTGFSGRAGKLFFLDTQDKSNFQIFFDDNISEYGEYYSIVDVREC